ncbi:MAG: alpha/beta fold hydrolase [Brevundimonas sp.]|uniref:alpha/beta fold hydrolase n=1 Tax=Brevundimonas sp. TaxID=1871086 RepID=UPI00391CAA9A
MTQVVADPPLAALSAADPGAMLALPGGGQLAVKRCGRGTQVLCLHAVGHGSGDFADLAARLGDRFELIGLDWPGMARSPADAGGVRAEHFAGLVIEAVDALGLDRPFVIGNSIGGTAAIIAAAQAPARFAGLALCNPGGLSRLDLPARLIIGRMAAFFRTGTRGACWYPFAFAAYYRWLVLTRAPARSRREAIVRHAVPLAPLLADAWEGFGKPSGDLRSLAPRLSLPVWLAWARGDQFVSWGRAKAAVATMPLHRVTLFRGSHSAFLEDPNAFAAGFRAFVHDVQTGNFQ